MKNAEERLNVAVGGLVPAAVGLGLALWLGSGYLPGGLAVVTVLAVVNLVHTVREKRRVREEMRPAAEDFARALAALQEKKARGRQAV